MSLNETGRTGVKVNLTADGVFGIVTQDPESMLNSPGGLTNADGNTAFGQTFKLVAYLSRTATGTTSVNLCSSDAPFKFRVLKTTVRVLDDAKNRVQKTPHGSASVVVRRGSTGTGVAAGHFEELRTNESKELPVSTEGNDIVAANASLQVHFDVSLPTQKASTTYTAVCELECVRVI